LAETSAVLAVMELRRDEYVVQIVVYQHGRWDLVTRRHFVVSACDVTQSMSGARSGSKFSGDGDKGGFFEFLRRISTEADAHLNSKNKHQAS